MAARTVNRSDARGGAAPSGRLAPFGSDDPLDDLIKEIGPPPASGSRSTPARSSGPGWTGWLLAAVWLGVALGAPIAYWGVPALAIQHPALLTVIGAIALFPALAVLAIASAVRDAAMAREHALLAAELVDASRAAAPSAAKAEQTAWREAAALGAESADKIAALIAKQRAELDDLRARLQGDTEQMAQSVGRQIRLLREASRLVGQETASAETAFAENAGVLENIAASLAKSSDEVRSAARATADMQTSLHDTLGQAHANLDALREVTSAAKTMSEDTVAAAAATAKTLRDAGHHALAEARRAAQLVRAEAAAMQSDLDQGLARLAQNAEAARTAALEATIAAEVQSTATARRRPEPVAAATPIAEPTPRQPTVADDLQLDWMSPRLRTPIAVLDNIGVPPREVINDGELELIGRRARLGPEARRRAVLDVAPAAVHRIADVINRDAKAQAWARAFQGDPGFDPQLPFDRWNRRSELTRAYLLVDAALG